MRTLLLILGLCAAALPAFAQAPVTRVYDVKALCLKIVSEVGPEIGLVANIPGGGVSIDMVEEDDAITVEALQNLITDNIEPDSWEGAYSVRTRGGALLVTAPPATQEKVSYMLAYLRAKQIRTVTLEVLTYRGPSTALDALVKGGAVLDDARIAALGQAPWKRVRQARVRAFSGQRVNVARLRQTSLLIDYDSEVAEKERVHDPEIRAVNFGGVDDLEPVLADDGKGLLITCRHSGAKLLKRERFDAGITNFGGKKVGALDQPIVAEQELRTSIWLPAGGTGIVGATSRDGQVSVTLVRHRDRALTLPKRPKATSRRILELIDSRYAAYRIVDFVGPDLQHMSASAAAGPGAVFDAGDDEAGVELSPEALLEMIQSNIEPDSWEHSRNLMALIGGKLLVHQTPPVAKQTVAYVRQIEYLRSISILVRGRLFRARGEAAADALTGLAGELTGEQRAALDKLLADDQQVETLDDLAITALPSQRVYAAGGTNRMIVNDHDVEIANGSRAHDPETRLLRVGSAFDVRPTLVQSGDRVMLDVRLSHAALRELRVAEIGEGIKIQLPDLDYAFRRATLVLANGKSGLVDLGGGRFALVEVHTSRAKRPKKDADKGADKGADK